MPRYITRQREQTKQWWHYMPDDYSGFQRATSITVTDSPPMDTGLVDASGASIMRVPDPIGFPLVAEVDDDDN